MFSLQANGLMAREGIEINKSTVTIFAINIAAFSLATVRMLDIVESSNPYYDLYATGLFITVMLAVYVVNDIFSLKK